MLEAENEENAEMQPYYQDLYDEFRHLLNEGNPQLLDSIKR